MLGLDGCWGRVGFGCGSCCGVGGLGAFSGLGTRGGAGSCSEDCSVEGVSCGLGGACEPAGVTGFLLGSCGSFVVDCEDADGAAAGGAYEVSKGVCSD